MTSTWTPPRLRPFLGTDLDAVTPEALHRLIGVTEDTDLEFKSAPYESTDSAKRELALDLAALANGGGALLIIGMDQDAAGLATGLRPIPTGERDLALWTDQVAASRIFPALSLGYKAVMVDNGLVHLHSVPPSLRSPHAVDINQALRYPVRIGRHRRSLTEGEVGDRYQRRFSTLVGRASALDEQLALADRLISQTTGNFKIWLEIALTPDVPGDLRVHRRLVDEWMAWVPALLREFPAYNDRSGRYHIGIGFRSLILYDSINGRVEYWRLGGNLNLDGSGTLVFGYHGDPEQHVQSGGHCIAYDEFLIGDFINGLGVLSRHAQLAGATGDAQVAARLRFPSGGLVIGQCRDPIHGMLPNTRAAHEIGVSRHTISPHACVDPGLERLAAVRALSADLLSAFGQPEPLQITEQLQLVRGRFLADTRDRVSEWASRADVEVL